MDSLENELVLPGFIFVDDNKKRKKSRKLS